MNIKNEVKEAFVENKKIFAILSVIFIIGFIIGVIVADDIASILMPALKELVKNTNSIDAFGIIQFKLSTTFSIFV